MIDWVTKFNSFGQYKRMWYPHVGFETFAKLDNDRINILKDCAFINVTPIGSGLTGVTGDLDDAISFMTLPKVFQEFLPSLVDYARRECPPMHEHITEVAFLAAFTKIGEMEFHLNGVLHTNDRLLPAITRI